MHPKNQSLPSINFYQHDIVQETSDNSLGIVLRCWHDAEDNLAQETYTDPMMRPLNPGEVGVSFVRNGGERKILPESELRLVDRTIRPGDFCKRTIDDVQSGVVDNVHIRARLDHVISGEPVVGWKTADELAPKMQAEIGDYVLYDDWIGQVVELYDESIIEVSSGRLVRLPELGSRLNVGEKSNDILSPARYDNPFGYSDGFDTVVAVKHTAYAITWLAISQMLSPAEAEKKPVPQMLWHGEDLGKLALLSGRVGSSVCVGDRVCLRNGAGAPVTRHGEGGDAYPLQVYIVVETRTDLDILWQDGKKETVASTDVIPYLNPDECDCWPGDHVVWKGEDSKRHAIVQSVNALDRTAQILLPDTGAIELASILELDPTGWSDLAAIISPSMSEGLGVHRGDFVFIHPEGTTNGFAKPVVPVIGELEAWVHQTPLNDGGWRQDLAKLGANIAEQRPIGTIKEAPIRQLRPGSGDFAWVGEVTNLNLDGTIEVTHPDFTVKIYPLDRLTKLHNTMEHLDDELWGDEDSESQGTHSEDSWSMDESEDAVSHSSYSRAVSEYKETEQDDLDAMNIDSREWGGESTANTIKVPRSEATLTEAPSTSMDQSVKSILKGSTTKDDPIWKQFDILASAPPDHAFLSSPPAQPSKVFLSRLTKEYRALSSGLPDSILVRVYEDRTDLLRSLIIGPANTPYEDAPFMIDWMLDSNFPNSPPIAHFHSWTNGNGRVNPNLYEEGKVCLSILGTWSGDRDETWNAARSSLLQAFVSIQGLVLVKEPWFCEPAYEKLRGTEEGTVNSRLYNEKVFVLSRAFVRRALETPLGGLEAEIRSFYYQENHLDKILQGAQRLIEKSKANSELNEVDAELAVPRLTVGGIIALSRTLTRLQTLLTSSQPS